MKHIYICMNLGWGIKTTGAPRAPVAPPSLAPLYIHVCIWHHQTIIWDKKNLYSVKKKLFFSKGIHFMGTTVAAIMVGTSKTIISKKKRENST